LYCHGSLLSSYVVGIPTSHFMFGAVGLAGCRGAPVAAVAALASKSKQAKPVWIGEEAQNHRNHLKS
jgi:hypothetical protein